VWNERLRFAGTPAPTARQLGSFASVASAVYYSGGFYVPGTPVPLESVTPTYLEVYYGPAVAATASPTPAPTSSPTRSPTYGPCAVTAPTNGALGTCTSSLALGGTCQFSCSDGYGVSGPTSCSATMVLAAATCMTGAWTTRKAVPAMSYRPLQGAGTHDTFMYAYIAGAKSPLPANRGELYKYSSTIDVWTSGPGPRMQATSAPGCCSARDGRIGRACTTSFVRAAQKCPDAKLYLAASAVVAATMYMVGGDEGPSVPTYPTVISKYSILADAWTSASRPPTTAASRTAASGPHFGSAAAVGSRIFYVGGAIPPYSVNEVYETTTDSWTTAKAAPASAPTAYGTLLSARGNLLYTLAVKFPTTVPQPVLHMYNATTDQWTSRAPPTHPPILPGRLLRGVMWTEQRRPMARGRIR
jgi:hypothetical protein